MEEAEMREGRDLEFAFGEGPAVKTRVLRAEHIVATAVRLGRLKDLARVEAFLDQHVVDLAALKDVLVRFDLMAAWKAFCFKAARADILG